MALTHTRSSLSLLALSLLALHSASSVSAQPSTGVVDLITDADLSSDGVFEFDYDSAPEQFYSYDDELPAPEPADYQLASEEEQAAIWERSVDGNEAAKMWRKRGLTARYQTHHLEARAATVSCKATTDCSSSSLKLVDNSHHKCNKARGQCVWECNSGFTSNGSACVKDGASSGSTTVACTDSADCRTGTFTPVANSFAKCNKARGYCVSDCNSGYTMSGTTCVKNGSTGGSTKNPEDVTCSVTADCSAANPTLPANSHHKCNSARKQCTFGCNSGYTSTGSACVKEGTPTPVASDGSDVTCSATADCTKNGYQLPTNSHYRCNSSTKRCTFACNSGYSSTGAACIKGEATPETDVSGPGKAWTGKSSFKRAGETGVSAMQTTLVDDDHILIYDKAENNALKDKSGASAWGSLYTISTQKVRALNLKTNSFCAGGGWISNGTLVNLGGNPQQTYINDKAEDGLMGVRLFTPCTNDKCDVYENPSRIRLTSARWYPSTARLTDGSLLIAGGMVAGGYNNQESTDNPTFEFYPPKGDGLQFYSKFLHDALNSNLYPIMWTLPSGYVFIAANKIAMLYDWETNTERRIKSLPNGVAITYPASAATALLPLTVENNWTPEVIFFGGTTADLDGDPSKLSATYPASNQVSRMVLDAAGIKKGWQVETMSEGRVMSDAIIMPDGQILLINGAQQGVAGYGNVRDEIGASNSREPIFSPVLYSPNAEKGKRFTDGFATTTLERLYHSSATLLPDGSVWVAGSNPNDGVSTVTYRTRYEVEIFSPPYMSMTRPTYSGLASKILYGKSYTLTVNVPAGTKKVQVALIDIGYSTHGVHMSNRYVELEATLSGKTLTFKAPKNTGIYPPAPGWIYILADGIPSKGKKVMVGPGNSPPVSQSAIRNMLKKT